MIAVDEGWDLATRHQFNEARDVFVDRTRDGKDIRRDQLGEAAMLINLQPRIPANLDRADQLLTTLYKTIDEVGISALYLSGRIDQSHRIPHRVTEAKTHYTQLAALNSEHPLAQAGIVQLALLQLYDETLPLSDRFVAAEALAANLAGTFARSDYHLVLARSYLFFQTGDDHALNHFLAAIKSGITTDRIRADALISAGELALDLGQTTATRQCYEQFLRENPRDPRKPTVQSRLGALR
jgi:tetratricopeptide (TPR) repeat protein